MSVCDQNLKEEVVDQIPESDELPRRLHPDESQSRLTPLFSAHHIPQPTYQLPHQDDTLVWQTIPPKHMGNIGLQM